MNDIMIDLETASLQLDATIFSIGAVVFDRATGEIGNRLHIALCVQNRHSAAETIKWWDHPDQRKALIALVELTRTNLYRIDLGLEKLARFIAKNKTTYVWSNGAAFDIAILTHAYRQLDMPIPWRFWHERDTRTILDACRQITGIDPKKRIYLDGTAHTALDDAIYQARYVAKAYQLLTNHNGSIK